MCSNYHQNTKDHIPALVVPGNVVVCTDRQTRRHESGPQQIRLLALPTHSRPLLSNAIQNARKSSDINSFQPACPCGAKTLNRLSFEDRYLLPSRKIKTAEDAGKPQPVLLIIHKKLRTCLYSAPNVMEIGCTSP